MPNQTPGNTLIEDPLTIKPLKQFIVATRTVASDQFAHPHILKSAIRKSSQHQFLQQKCLLQQIGLPGWGQ